MTTTVTSSRGIAALKAAILGTAAFVFLAPLATPLGLVAGVGGVLVGTWLARRLRDVRALPLLVGSALVAALGVGAAALVTAYASVVSPVVSSSIADALRLGALGLGTATALRYAASRWVAASAVELGLILASASHAFAAHRRLHINQPRALADWAWTHGFQPEAVLAAFGLFAFVIGVLVLVRRNLRAGVMAILLLLMVGGAVALFVRGAPTLGRPEPDKLESTVGDSKAKSGSSSSKRNRDPVAVVLLKEDLPRLDILYFRQAVRSRLLGRVLVEDQSGNFDTDVPSTTSPGTAVQLSTPQAPAYHRHLSTSMFLLADHAQLPGLAFPTSIQPIQNPNPRRFVAAYDVESQVPLRDADRLLGRSTNDAAWTPQVRAHYLQLPDDPRYRELATRIVRDLDPRFFGDSIMQAYALKQYLEKEGFYSFAERDFVGNDPIGAFLFESLRGYCVHFAHAAVFLMRAMGIPSRVAIGYAVQSNLRGAGSSILIYGNEAHAWPEMYVEGVGWVTLDIYPERSDEPAVAHVDGELESAMGELARGDPLAGRVAKPIPWTDIGMAMAYFSAALLCLAWAIKIVRRLPTRSPRRAFRAALDSLADFGLGRMRGESREAHARRVGALAPSFSHLTWAYLRRVLGPGGTDDAIIRLSRAARAEVYQLAPLPRRTLAAINPIGWWFSR